MSKHPLFKTKIEHRSSAWNPSYELEYVQCPVCKRWFNHFGRIEFMGVKLHIRKWATKEATGHALGEIKKMPHLEFWKANTQVVQSIPKAREWTV